MEPETLALAPMGYCSWCYKPIHVTPVEGFKFNTWWCDCGWWDALPERWEY